MADAPAVLAPFPPTNHDHGRCVADALTAAEKICGREGLAFTALRRRVLELVWSSHGPVGAYELLDALRDEGRRAAPPTVYRALDFLGTHGLVHRIESLNAFIGCARPDQHHGGQFLICRDCGAAAEIDDPTIAGAVQRRAEALGFSVDRQTIEITGQCPRCRRRGENSGAAG
jgi:Fur family zinc uptake transcriptional regulator